MDRKYLKLAVAILLALYCFYYLTSPQDWHFIDSVDLIIHEAGHVIFWPFGEFMHVLGGSLNQVLVPLLFVWYFYYNKQNYSAALTLFWVGINFISVGIYAGDAVAMKLQLITGGTGWEVDGHDWNALLIYMGQLHHAVGIGTGIKLCGILCFIIATVWAITSALKENTEQETYG